MSKFPGPFWHEKYILFDILIIMGIILSNAVFIPKMINHHHKYSTLIWILWILAWVIIIGLKTLLIWFVETKKNKNHE